MKRPLGIVFLLLPCLAAQTLATRKPAASLTSLLGVPYVEDGGLDEQGRWVRISRPEEVLGGPGLNCSGLVIAASRRLLDYRGSLAEAGRDRSGDSGSEAKLGQDWDYGWDLVLNLSEGHTRIWFLPEGTRPVPGTTGRSLAGFQIHDREAWARLEPRWRTDRVYLATLIRGRGGRIRHHHVALLLKEASGRLWFYQTLPKGRAHRLALDTPEGMARLCTMFGPGERMLILEVER